MSGKKFKSMLEVRKALYYGEITQEKAEEWNEYFILGPSNKDDDCDASEVDIY